MCRDDAKIRNGLKKCIEVKQLGDDAFKKNDQKLAFKNYSRICITYSKKVTRFLTNQAKAAEEDKKWRLCYDLCRHLTLLEFPFSAEFSVRTFDQEMKNTFTEGRVLMAKAQRRLNNLEDDFDKKFLEELAANQERMGGDNIITYELFKRANPHLTRLTWEKLETFQRMADFSGNGKVTVKELNLFIKYAHSFRNKSR